MYVIHLHIYFACCFPFMYKINIMKVDYFKDLVTMHNVKTV